MNEIIDTTIYTYRTESRVIIELRHSEAWEAFSEIQSAKKIAPRYPSVMDEAQLVFYIRLADWRGLLRLSSKSESWWAE